MTILLLSDASSQTLKALLSIKPESQSSSDASPACILPDNLLNQLTLTFNPKITLESPAVLSDGSDENQIQSQNHKDKELKVDSRFLIDLSNWARNTAGNGVQIASLDPTSLTLNSLLRNARIYHPPKPVRVRSPELESQLTLIRLEKERQEYQEMLSSRRRTPASNPFNLSSLTSASNSSTPGTGRFDPAPPAGGGGALPDHLKLSPEQEIREWNLVKKQLSAMFNVLLSMVATGTAAWWALGNVGIAFKTVTSLLISFLIGIAEAVLYSRHWKNVEERQKQKQSGDRDGEKSRKKKTGAERERERFNFSPSMRELGGRDQDGDGNRNRNRNRNRSEDEDEGRGVEQQKLQKKANENMDDSDQGIPLKF